MDSSKSIGTRTVATGANTARLAGRGVGTPSHNQESPDRDFMAVAAAVAMDAPVEASGTVLVAADAPAAPAVVADAPEIIAQAAGATADGSTGSGDAGAGGVGAAATAGPFAAGPIIAGGALAGIGLAFGLGGGGSGGGATSGASNTGATAVGSGSSTTSQGSPTTSKPAVPDAPTIEQHDAAVTTHDVYNGGVVVKGTAVANSSVEVHLGSAVHSVTADASGVYSTSFASNELPAADGAVQITVIASNSAGSSSAATSSLMLDRYPGQLTIAPVSDDDVLTAAEAAGPVTIHGTSDAGSHISVSLFGGDAAVVTADANGLWSASVLPGASYSPAGHWDVVATQVDAAGNQDPAIYTRDVQVLTDPPVTWTVYGEQPGGHFNPTFYAAYSFASPLSLNVATFEQQPYQLTLTAIRAENHTYTNITLHWNDQVVAQYDGRAGSDGTWTGVGGVTVTSIPGVDANGDATVQWVVSGLPPATADRTDISIEVTTHDASITNQLIAVTAVNVGFPADHNLIVGGVGNNELVSTVHDDTMYGGLYGENAASMRGNYVAGPSAADAAVHPELYIQRNTFDFSLAHANGNDTIKDFHLGADTVELTDVRNVTGPTTGATGDLTVDDLLTGNQHVHVSATPAGDVTLTFSGAGSSQAPESALGKVTLEGVSYATLTDAQHANSTSDAAILTYLATSSTGLGTGTALQLTPVHVI